MLLSLASFKCGVKKSGTRIIGGQETEVSLVYKCSDRSMGVNFLHFKEIMADLLTNLLMDGHKGS